MDLLTELTILVLAAFVGFEVISKVPNTLHTPLMSATNAIHGIVLLGGLYLIGPAEGFLNNFLCVIAIAFGTINVVGGFLVTDRMLHMFRRQRLMNTAMASFLQDPDFIRSLYIVAFVLFIVDLRLMNHPRTARKGNVIGAIGMGIAVIATLLIESVGDYALIALGIAVGTAVGVPAARSVKMTAMPQMVALFNGVGGGAVALISWVEYREALAIGGNPELEVLIPILFAAIIGSVSFWGSNIAFGKLQEILPGRPIQLPGQQFINIGLLLVCVGSSVAIASGSESEGLFILILVAAAVLGNMFVLPIGGADMPVVISLLNAFTGLSAAAAGLALDNVALIVAGMLVGASGSILTMQMAEAMNRSIANIFKGGFGGGGTAPGAAADGEEKPVRSTDAADVAIQLAYASRVVVAPGYGLAVAQAQHAVRELANALEKRGVEVLLCDPPGGGPDAGPHERAARRGGRALRQPQGNGRDQPRVPADRCGACDRGQRRDEPSGARRARLAHLRDADPQRGPGSGGDRPEALDEHRLRGHRQPALLRGEHIAPVRRRQGVRAEGLEGARGVVVPAGILPAPLRAAIPGRTPSSWRVSGATGPPPPRAPSPRRP